MPFNIENLQFVTKDNRHNIETLPGKTLHVVCCERTKLCLELLVPYQPDEKDFLFFEHVFSAPHIFRKTGTVAQIATRPEILDRFFKTVEETVLKIDRTDLREAFFKCLEVDISLEVHKQTTGLASYPILEFIDWLEKLKKDTIVDPLEFVEEKESPSNPDFTTARQVLAILYLLDYCKVQGIDQTQKARFIEFLTNKNLKNIYDLVRSPLATKRGNFRKEDLQFIRPYFENLGLVEIVKMINNQLDKPDL